MAGNIDKIIADLGANYKNDKDVLEDILDHDMMEQLQHNLVNLQLVMKIQ